jgi:signal transduction histidine kinase
VDGVNHPERPLPSGRITVSELAVMAFIFTVFGISKDNMKMLFQPLFTTKSKGQGMGLAVAKRIIEAHKGTITAENVPKTGTTFIIKVPKQQERQI